MFNQKSMMETLRITTVQSSLVWEDISANLENFEKQLKPLSGATDLVILPEMFTTGFSMNPAALAETMTGQTMEWMKKEADYLNAAIIGSFIAVENGKYYNRLVMMYPNGDFKVYDKRHLFTLAGEQFSYTAGKKKLIAEWKGWRICPLVCYDLRFPVWSRNVEDYDLLIYIANWPDRRKQAWNILLAARAVENQVYTVGVNRVGTDGTGLSYVGDSAVIDFAGNILYKVSECGQVATVNISYEDQLQFRDKLRFLADRDDFEIND